MYVPSPPLLPLPPLPPPLLLLSHPSLPPSSSLSLPSLPPLLLPLPPLPPPLPPSSSLPSLPSLPPSSSLSLPSLPPSSSLPSLPSLPPSSSLPSLPSLPSLSVPQAFFRRGILIGLDQKVELRTHDTMVLFQARCRGYLGRKRFEQLELLDSAAYVIQSNVAVWMEIRDWSWWKLYSKVRRRV